VRRIYLDNAATSWPKPEVVYDAVNRYLREGGAAAGRGVYGDAVETSVLVSQCRRGIARLINSGEEHRIIFTLNGTDSLNLAIHGLLDQAADRPHVVTTEIEHNSVLRPLRMLEQRGLIDVTRVGCDSAGLVDADEVRKALRPNTRLVALNHASNVTGAIQPAAEIGRIAREAGAVYLLDAAQTLGDIEVDVMALGVDLLAASGHKGLLGPLGTGVLYVGPRVESQLHSTRQGGTGTQSELDMQPDELPEKYESGNLNVPGIVGLGAAVAWLAEQGIASIRAHAIELTDRLLAGLTTVDGLRVMGPADARRQVGLVSVAVQGYDPQELAAMLDAGCRIQSRAGLHCAPRVHEAIGTVSQGGTLRLSIGPFNTAEDIDAAVDALRQIAAAG